MKKTIPAAFLALAFCLATCWAATEETIIVRADRMLDPASGKIIPDAHVAIQGRRIVAVGGREIVREFKGRLVDLGGLTLLPGLVDTHVHLAIDIDQGFAERAMTQGPIDDAFRAVRNARKTLLAGFTTVREAGSAGFLDVSLMKAVEGGLVEGPWIIPCGHGIGMTGGHGDITGLAPGILERTPESGVADGVDQVMKAVRYQIKHGAKQIKLVATAGVLSFESSAIAQQYSAEEIRACVEEAKRAGIKVFAHAHGLEGILTCIKAGVASIEHGSMIDAEAVRLMKEKGTYLVPTTYLVDAIKLDVLPPLLKEKAISTLRVARENLKMAIQSGVEIAFGTDAGVYPHGDNAREFAVYVKLGMSPLEAVRTATVNAADLLGVTDRGVIEKGRLADLIAVKGNPLEDITTLERVLFVMQGGRIVKSEAR